MKNAGELYDNIKNRRIELGMSQEELAEKMGYTDRSSISKIEAGKVDLSQSKILRFAEVLNTTASDLMGDSGNNPEPKIESDFIRFPIIGNIKAGYGKNAIMEYTDDYAYFAPQDIHVSAEDYFVLRVKGDSMYPRILDGDIVLVHKQPSVDSGDIAVVMYDNVDATIKKVNYVYGEDWLELIPINPEYQIKRIENADLELCRVLGKVVKLQRNI